MTPELETDQAVHLQRLWTQLRQRPFPASTAKDPRLQEIALYGSWLGSIVEAALAQGGRLSPTHASLVEFRRQEGNQALWAAAAELGEPARSYVARLIAIEDILTNLPRVGTVE